MRHGDTELSSTERLWGHTDVTLSDAGFRQAERLCHRLATEKIDAVYSSDLKRAALTAETITAGHKLNVITCPELREVNFGKLEGLTFDQIRQLHPEVARLWLEASPGLKFPDGESINEFNDRVSKFPGKLEKHSAEETILIVAHSGSLRLLVCRLLGTDLRHWWQIRLSLASLTVIETHPQGAMLTCLNDVCHLTETS